MSEYKVVDYYTFQHPVSSIQSPRPYTKYALFSRSAVKPLRFRSALFTHTLPASFATIAAPFQLTCRGSTPLVALSSSTLTAELRPLGSRGDAFKLCAHMPHTIQYMEDAAKLCAAINITTASMIIPFLELCT